MTRASLLMFAVLAFSCGSPGSADAGGGGSATGGGATTGGGGGSTGGGGGSATGGGGGASPWDGGSTWTLVGPVAPTVGWMTSGFQSFDGGYQDTRRFLALYFDQPGVTACTSPNTPFEVLEVRVELEDGGVVGPGTYQFGQTSFVTYTRYTSTGMALDVGGIGATGTVTITRFDGRSSAGSFTTTLSSWADGGTSALSGTWDTAVLDCR